MPMTIEKAVENLTIELSAWPHKGTQDWYASVSLGIEALKHLEHERSLFTYPLYQLLPGETQD